jgi:toxin ParE1/3/4
MDFKVILAPRAIQDLQEIIRYISIDNPTRAESFGRELIGKTRRLASFPEMGRVVPEVNDPSIREIIYHTYRIVYRVRQPERRIEVSRFWHAARGTPNL